MRTGAGPCAAVPSVVPVASGRTPEGELLETAPGTGPASGSPVQWRRLQRNLWVARHAGAPLGSIERGRRYVTSDTRGARLGAFPSLEQAQEALLGTGNAVPEQRSRSLLVLPSVGVVAVTSMLGVALWALEALIVG